MGSRGVIGDKWSMRVLWACAIGSAIGLYMVAVDRQMKNRERMLAESLKAESDGVDCSKISQNHNNNLRTKRKNYVNMRSWRAGQGCYISPGKPIYSLERALIRTGCTTVSPLLSFENG
ncbi:hypothetical protein CUMW_194920 [Citrus unshiu]|nr:hypothetical protein CUMW_194920 [Citrus unshiu]